MKHKNFSEVLNDFMSITEIKMKDLAVYLDYDISYINKWVNGKNIPSQKIAEAIYQIYDLATRSMYVNSEIFYTEEENFPPFIYIKGKIALSFSTNDQGEVLMMTHSRNSSVL
ncbi:MAG: helix-turn-helix transcriptional regulator, partial [Gallicola sp.]|nr:helix-turn-helix transcriptional regulator [Gallicola sp.]